MTLLLRGFFSAMLCIHDNKMVTEAQVVGRGGRGLVKQHPGPGSQYVQLDENDKTRQRRSIRYSGPEGYVEQQAEIGPGFKHDKIRQRRSIEHPGGYVQQNQDLQENVAEIPV